MFNSLKYAKQLEEVGVSREQAEVHMQIMTEIVETSLATKQDIKDLKVSLSTEMKEMNASLSAKIDALGAQMTTQIVTAEYHGVLKVGAMVATATTLLMGFMKIFV